MADRYYSIHPEESSFLNYGTCIQPPASTMADLNHAGVNYFAPAAESNNRLATMRYLAGQAYGKPQAAAKFQNASYVAAVGIQPQSQAQQQQQAALGCHFSHGNGSCGFNRNRYVPYNRSCAGAACAGAAGGYPCNYQQPQQAPQPAPQQQQPQPAQCGFQPNASFDRSLTEFTYANVAAINTPVAANNATTGSGTAKASVPQTTVGHYSPESSHVTLQINNLDYSMDEANLRNFLLGQLKPITPVVSLVFEGSSYAKVTVPDLHFAKQVVANLHRKKVGHKRMIVSYTRDSSLTEINTLRCQVAGLLKDVPYCTLPMYKFRELFQSRFKTSISVLDLYKMQDICSITADKNEEKFISLQPELINSIESSPLMEGLQHSVPYCTVHFKREQHKGWAEQEIEPLPNVYMTISEIQQVIYPLLKNHPGDIPVASLVHCIGGQLNIQVARNEAGVNLEHLICCVHGIQITTNNFGIKILGWLEPENAIGKENGDGRYAKNGTVSDPLYQISREVVELVKMSPKSTMKFNRFIPAYHNHFGKQCRVADYGYTKLIELFEALSGVIQIMGDGENRQITLTHRTQIRRFTSDLLRILRAQGNKSILLSQLPKVFSHTQNRGFDVTDYGVCDIVDILDGLVNSNIVVLTTVQNGKDILISIPKRKQTLAEIEKTCVFAGEVVELFRNAPQYAVLFQKFVRSYHYHFGYQCRLSDYGFLKLADLMEAIQGVVEMEFTNDEDKKIFLSPKVAQRVFAEQLEELIRNFTGSTKTCMKLDEVLQLHKKKFGYQIQHQTLGVERILDAIRILPYVEILETDDIIWIICHKEDAVFRVQCYRSCKLILEHGKELLPINDFINLYGMKYNEILAENTIMAMKHALQLKTDSEQKLIGISHLMRFIINVVRLLEQRPMMLADIKNILNVEVSFCFKFGYPNLYTMLSAYNDVFQVESGVSQERSEISLVPQNELTTNAAPARTQTAANSKPHGKKRQALAEYNRPSKMAPPCMEANMYQPPMTKKSSPPNGVHLYKDSSFTGMFNSSFNSSMTSELNLSVGSATGSNNSATSSGGNSSVTNTTCGSNASTGSAAGTSMPKLWDRRQAATTNYYTRGMEQSSIFDIVNTMPMCPYYEPPKPDTPPSDNMPFWIDPIWVNSNGENKPPKIDSLNIRLPEFRTANILPMLMSPYTLSKTENMKKMFSFDNADKKIT